MEQPPGEAPEVREEEEKKEVAEAEGAPELNGGPERSLPSSSYTGEEGEAGDTGQRTQSRPSRDPALCKQHHGAQRGRARQPGSPPLFCCSSAAGPQASCTSSFCETNGAWRGCGQGLL